MITLESTPEPNQGEGPKRDRRTRHLRLLNMTPEGPNLRHVNMILFLVIN